MKISQVEFVKSSAKLADLPSSNFREYAFIGRSNVGKSSLLNLLASKKKLAKTSSKAGKTILINHFLVNKSWCLVDLPGYGYASLSKGQREKIQKLALDYILCRENLYFLFLLIDSRLPPQKIDLDFTHFLAKNNIAFGFVFTKIDKLSASKLENNLSLSIKELEKDCEELPPIFRSSALRGQGREAILDFIESI